MLSSSLFLFNCLLLEQMTFSPERRWQFDAYRQRQRGSRSECPPQQHERSVKSNGFWALINNTSGNYNTANGFSNTNGSFNVANGYQALFANTSGSWNTADGDWALNHNTTGSNNTASGEAALYNNTTGTTNIGLGHQAGFNLTIGNDNIDIGNPGVAVERSTIR